MNETTYSVWPATTGGGSVTKELRDVQMAIPLDHWEQHSPPEFCAGVIAAPEHRSFQVAILIEQEQRVIAHTLEVPVISRALLFSVGFTDRAIQVEDQFFQGLARRSTGRRDSSTP